MRGKGISCLVAVVALKGDAVFDDAQMGVRIDKSRQQQQAGCVNVLSASSVGLPDSTAVIFSVLDADIAVFNDTAVCHRMYGCIQIFMGFLSFS